MDVTPSALVGSMRLVWYLWVKGGVAQKTKQVDM